TQTHTHTDKHTHTHTPLMDEVLFSTPAPPSSHASSSAFLLFVFQGGLSSIHSEPHKCQTSITFQHTHTQTYTHTHPSYTQTHAQRQTPPYTHTHCYVGSRIVRLFSLSPSTGDLV